MNHELGTMNSYSVPRIP